jgi:hypothetical protein
MKSGIQRTQAHMGAYCNVSTPCPGASGSKVIEDSQGLLLGGAEMYICILRMVI